MSGLARAWVRTNVRTARRLLAECQDLTPDERLYLNSIVSEGEQFLQLTRSEPLAQNVLKRYQ